MQPKTTAKKRPNPRAATEAGAKTRVSITRAEIERYQAFVAGTDLRRMRLVSASLSAVDSLPDPAKHEVNLSPEFKEVRKVDSHHVEVFQGITLRFIHSETGQEAGSIHATFAVLYRTQLDTADAAFDEVFGRFRSINVMLNLWPYMREFVQTMTTRMDWAPFTLPLLKRG